MTSLRVCPNCDDMHAKGERCPDAIRRTQRRRDVLRGPSPYDSVEWKKLVRFVLKRDGFTCQLARPGCSGRASTGDHVVPISQGGIFLDPTNVVAACKRCNSGKGNRITVDNALLP